LTNEAIFRKAAIDRLSSPEQLDHAIEVVQPRAWLALGGIALLLIAALVFAFTASIPTRVAASGILISPGGVMEVVAPADGHLTSVDVTEGTVVRKGQVIARTAQPDLVRAVEDARSRVAELQKEHARVASFGREDVSLQSRALLQKQANLQSSVRFFDDRVGALRDRLRNEEELFQQGLFTRQLLLATRQELFAAIDQQEKSRAALSEIAVQELALKNSAAKDLYGNAVDLSEAERQLRAKERELAFATQVLSPANGRVVEVKADPGVLVHAGQGVVSLQLTDDVNPALRLVAYVSSTEGKRIVPGMEVHVTPSAANGRESGYLRARVSYVSEFPSTTDAMRRVLGSEELARTLSGSGAPFAVYADLLRDPQTRAYVWSSGKGTDAPVNSGTICTATIVVRRQRPIEMVLPGLRDASGMN